MSSTTVKEEEPVRPALFCVSTDFAPGTPAVGVYEYVRVTPEPEIAQFAPIAAALGNVVLAMPVSPSAGAAVTSNPPLAALSLK